MSVKDLFDLSGKVALVTGGSRGLGLEMATALGEMRVLLGVIVFANAANAFLNWVFIYGHLGAPALGIVGAGYYTAANQWIMLAMLAGFLALAADIPREHPAERTASTHMLCMCAAWIAFVTSLALRGLTPSAPVARPAASPPR